MNLTDFILQIENDLKSEADASHEEMTKHEDYLSKQGENPKTLAPKGNTKSNDKDTLTDEESDDEEIDSDDIEIDDDEPDTRHLDISSEIDLAKALDYEEFVEIINHFRAGSSFKDNNEVKSFWQRLSKTEKMTLYALVAGLTQVSAGGVDGDKAPTPASMGIKISKKHTKADKEKSQNRKADIEAISDTKGKPSDDAAPIVVGESQDKSCIQKKLISLSD